MLRNIGAIVGGYLITSILTGITIVLMGLVVPASLDPSNTGWVIVNILYGAVFAVIGGYICARIAPENGMRNVLILAGIMLIFGIMTMIASLPYLEETGQPAWYYPLLLVLTIPATVLGGVLFTKQVPQKRKNEAF